jgi:hypothetical protein
VFDDSGLIGRWSPGIGDPTLGGWFTVVLYFVGTYACFRASRGVAAGDERRVWQVLSLGLLALGVNKQLDLQSAVTEIGRLLAESGGWYENRHEVQRLFIAVVGLLGIAGSVVSLALSRKMPLPTRVAVVGAISLVLFVVVRAASFHHFDLFIRAELFGLRMNWIFEIGGITIVALAARARLSTRTPPEPTGR